MPPRLLRHSLFRTAARDSFFHIVYRTNCREPLAVSAKDRRALNGIAIDTLQRFDMKLHAYCLMPTQLRALIEIDERVLVEALRRVALRYSLHKNLKSAGHLFERPYTAQRVETDDDFLGVLRNIHLNPVIANKVTSPEEYAWSSHRAYLGFRSNALLTTDRALSIFDPDRAKARAAYHQFIAAGIALNVGPKPHRENKRAAYDAMLERLLPTDDGTPAANPTETHTHIELSTVNIPTPKEEDGKPKQTSALRFLSIY